MGRPLKKNNLTLIYVSANADGSNVDGGEGIIKQVSGRRYKVETAHGTAICKLVADDTPAQYEMFMIASDSTGNDYFVTKLTRHHATLVRKAGGSDYEFSDGQAIKHNFGETPVANVSVALNYD